MNQTASKKRIPIDPQLLTQRTAAVAIDSLLQNSGRREHDDATRRIRRLGAGLRIAADALTFLDFCCHSSVSLQFRIANHREMRISTSQLEPVHASVYKTVVIRD